MLTGVTIVGRYMVTASLQWFVMSEFNAGVEPDGYCVVGKTGALGRFVYESLHTALTKVLHTPSRAANARTMIILL